MAFKKAKMSAVGDFNSDVMKIIFRAKSVSLPFLGIYVFCIDIFQLTVYLHSLSRYPLIGANGMRIMINIVINIIIHNTNHNK